MTASNPAGPAGVAPRFVPLSLGNGAAADVELGLLTEMVPASRVSDPAATAFVANEVQTLMSLGELQRAAELAEWLDKRRRALYRQAELAAAAGCRGLGPPLTNESISHWRAVGP